MTEPSPDPRLSELIEQCESYARALDAAERTNMGTSLTMDQAADTLRRAAVLLGGMPQPDADSPEVLRAQIALYREDPDAWAAERRRGHDFKVKLLTESAALRAELDAAWTAIARGWSIEDRAYFEREAPKNGFIYPLAQAIHHLWKRELQERGTHELGAASGGIASSPTWQPIETAPKDGTQVWLWWDGKRRLAHWHECVNPPSIGSRFANWLPDDKGSVSATVKPTLWFPLPAAPVRPVQETP